MTDKNQDTSNEEMESLENRFPAISGVAFATAQAQVLKSGQSLLQSENGAIYEVFPDGERRFVKSIEPPTSAIPGTKVTLR